MIRDPGPLSNIGHGVISRDVPVNEGETEGVARNSGFISKALNGHPVMKFVASTATTMLAAGVAGKLVRSGGLRLGKYIQNKQTDSVLATNFVKSATQIRQLLDELQGVSRHIDDIDNPYSKLVFDTEDGLTTGYNGISSERFGFSWLTAEEKNFARSGLLGNPNDVSWAFRDELQQRLVRAGRRLPYELPAFYLAQKGIADPLFGERDDPSKKVKWYNPVDVVSDFVTESAKNLTTMILPFEAMGAGASLTKSSLHNLKYGMGDLRSLTPIQQKMHKNFVNVNEVLSEVGHDFASLTNKFLKKTSKATGAFNAAAEEFKAQQKNLTQTLQELRHGAAAARVNAQRTNSSTFKAEFFSLFKPPTSSSPDSYSTLFDVIPSFRGLRAGLAAGRKEYRVLGYAQEAMESAIARNRILSTHFQSQNGEDLLNSAINRLQGLHGSRLSRLATGLRIMGGGGPGSDRFSAGQFSVGNKHEAFKGLIENELVRNGLRRQDAARFVSHLSVDTPKADTDITKLITIGKTQILEKDEVDFFSQIIKRYGGIKGSETFNVSPDALKRSVDNARAVFISRDFQKNLNYSIKEKWNFFYREDLQNVASTVLKPKKAMYQDFVGDMSNHKLEYMQRKTAETLGIKLIDTNGRMISNDIIKNKLAERGIDANAFTDLRAFLIKNKKMTSGIFQGGYNLFGMQQVTIDEAQQYGMFKHMREDEQQIIRDIAARTAINDPVSTSIGLSRLDGVYKSKNGELVDLTSIKSTFGKIANFFASEFKIPILGFNPTDLFGYNSFSEMARKSPIQYISSRSVQPFLGKAEAARAKPDFYIWNKTKGTKGRLTAFSRDSRTGEMARRQIDGLYRPIPTNSMDLLTRHTRYGANARGMSPDEIRAAYGEDKETFLSKVFGNENALKIKKFFAVDSEQPNSLFGLFSRFRNRGVDPDNPAVMARLLRGESIDQKINGVARKIKLDTSDGKLSVIDESGNIVTDISEENLIRAFHNLSSKSFQYGIPKKIMSYLEDKVPALFKFGDTGVSALESETEIVSFAESILKAQKQVAREVRRANGDPSAVLQSAARIKSLLNMSNLASASQLSKTSPTISTRIDELKNEIFRYISQTNLLTSGQNSDQIFVHLQEAIDDLIKKGVISQAQRAEAQAAGLSTLFNISAFKTYRGSEANIISERKKIIEVFNTAKSSSDVKKLFDPFIEGDIAQVSSGITRKFSPLLSQMKKKFGTPGYEMDPLAIDPLGSGQSLTMVPTFGTVFRRNPSAALKNAVGYTTYSDPDSFSLSSVPVSQGVERLNKYFGTLGMQIDVSSGFKGPLDLFARGMVGKRVLPIYAAGTGLMTIDRTLGGIVNEKDENGERVYSPLVVGQLARGAVEMQAAASGLIPGGMGYEEKREQLIEGEVPIRQGRFWPLGNTPFKGGKIMYYRPSWYRKLQGGAMFTDDTYGSPAEKFLFYNDISPLRPFDPYRFERKHYQDRPYPVTGEYFTGPFGPMVPLANMTIGKILKPTRTMHEEELQAGLAGYVSAGESGAYDTSAYTQPSSVGVSSSGFLGGTKYGTYPGSNMGFSSMQSRSNAMLASRAGSTNMAGGMVTQSIGNINAQYSQLSYGPPKVSRVMNPRIVGAGEPIKGSGLEFQTGELGYKTQEMLGIYGFAFGSLRQGFGFGQSDFEPQRAVLQSASKAYGTSRAFWDLNLGGLGDIPIVGAEGVGNVEFSEIVRRFIPKERTGVDYINPIKNTMGQKYPWLPGAEYYVNFRTGDPFTKVQEGELRLPGRGYERFNKLNPDEYGRYGLIDQLNILGDVAPYSQQYKSINSKLNKIDLSPDEKIKVQEIRQQVEDTTKKYEFKDYKYKDMSSEELGMSSLRYGATRIGEYIAHSDNFVSSKIFGYRTATEDWERRNVYGTTFPQWQNPVESYITPMINKATQRNPIVAAASLATAGAFFGRTPRARLFGTAVGGVTGFAASGISNTREFITGERYIPSERKKELALEEYTDILSYVKSSSLAETAEMSGDYRAAQEYRAAAKRTMYGADIFSKNIESLSLAIPKRKREHFKAMINAPVEEREKILSTAGRLERRIYEAAWGMDVEKRPDLVEYFTRHELPDASWEGWHPNTNIDHIKIKTGQSMGLDMSQMGYYPQQIKEANLVNPSYPSFFADSDRQDISEQLKRMMSGMGLTGSVSAMMTPFGGNQIDLFAGVR